VGSQRYRVRTPRPCGTGCKKHLDRPQESGPGGGSHRKVDAMKKSFAFRRPVAMVAMCGAWPRRLWLRKPGRPHRKCFDSSGASVRRRHQSDHVSPANLRGGLWPERELYDTSLIRARTGSKRKRPAFADHHETSPCRRHDRHGGCEPGLGTCRIGHGEFGNLNCNHHAEVGKRWKPRPARSADFSCGAATPASGRRQIETSSSDAASRQSVEQSINGAPAFSTGC